MKRYRLLDSIRGLTLLSMIAYHVVWDLVYLYGVPWNWYGTSISYLWQQSICWMFILLSGFCWSFGRKKLKRGLTVFGAGALITAVTLFVMPENRVIFGVLTLLGTCMMLQILLEPIWKKCNCYVGMILAFLLFLLCKDINHGYLALHCVALPGEWYANLFTTFIGFTEKGFYSTDYFSMIPWYFLFLTGYFLNGVLQEKNLLQRLPDIHIPPLEWLGRNSLWLYLLHQPVVFGILQLVM